MLRNYNYLTNMDYYHPQGLICSSSLITYISAYLSSTLCTHPQLDRFAQYVCMYIQPRHESIATQKRRRVHVCIFSSSGTAHAELAESSSAYIRPSTCAAGTEYIDGVGSLARCSRQTPRSAGGTGWKKIHRLEHRTAEVVLPCLLLTSDIMQCT